MTIFQRSPEYRKQSRSFFLTNTAVVHKELPRVVAVVGVHEPAIEVIKPTVTSVILPGAVTSGVVRNLSSVVDDGQQPASSAAFEEDFSSYTDTTHWRTDPNNYYAEIQQYSNQWIDTTVTDPEVDSNQTLLYQFPATSDGCSNYSITNTLRNWQNGDLIADQQVSEIWVEIRVRFASDWNTSPTAAHSCSGNPDYKLFRAFVAEGGYINYFQLKNGTTYDHNWFFGAPADPAGLTNAGKAHSSDDVSDDEWNVIRMHLKTSTDESTPDGRAYVEVNGRRLVDPSDGFDGEDLITASVDPVNGTGASYKWFRSLRFGLNRNHRRADAQRLWFSRWRVYDADPGWDESLPNLPEGAWVDMTDRPFDQLVESTPVVWDNFASGNAEFISGDGTNPRSGAGMMRIHYPLNHPGGNATINLGLLGVSTSTATDPKLEAYHAYWFRMSANFVQNVLSKMAFISLTRTDGSTKSATITAVVGVEGNPLDLQVRLQDLLGDSVAGAGGARNLVANVTAAPIVRNRWYFAEYYFKMNTLGNEDGEVHVWLDGAKRIEYTNISWDDGSLGGSEPSRMRSILLNNTWGGPTGVTNPVNSWFDIDHMVWKLR